MEIVYFFSMYNSIYRYIKKKKTTLLSSPSVQVKVHSRVMQSPQCHNRGAVSSASRRQGHRSSSEESWEDGH